MSQPTQLSLVTGANRGIGFEVCRQLAEQGHPVLLTARDLEKAEHAAAVLHAEGLEVRALRLDVTDAESIRQAGSQVESEYGFLDALVNNAAIDFDQDQTLFDADIDRMNAAFQTNTLGVLRVTQAFLPLLRKSRRARIVNVSSRAGSLVRMTGSTPAYSLSKIALNAMTMMMARQLEGSGILVNAVCPGWVATDMGGPNAGPVPKGAAGVVWGVTLPHDGPSGRFFRDGEEIPW